MMNCSMLQLVVCSSRGSGCGFVVVAVLFSLFAFRSVFFLSVCNQWTGRLLLTAWTWPTELSRPFAPKQDTACLDTRGATSLSTVMPFELLLYHKLIFAFFGFAVCSSCQNRSLFLCIVSFNVTNHRRTQDSSKNILNLLLQQFSVLSGEGKGGLSVSFAIFFPLTNKRSFLRVFPEDILVSSDCEVFTVFIFYQGWS